MYIAEGECEFPAMRIRARKVEHSRHLLDVAIVKNIQNILKHVLRHHGKGSTRIQDSSGLPRANCGCPSGADEGDLAQFHIESSVDTLFRLNIKYLELARKFRRINTAEQYASLARVWMDCVSR